MGPAVLTNLNRVANKTQNDPRCQILIFEKQGEKQLFLFPPFYFDAEQTIAGKKCSSGALLDIFLFMNKAMSGGVEPFLHT